MPNKRNLRIDRKRNPYTTTKNASSPSEEEEGTKVSRRKADQKRNLLGHLAKQALASYMTGRPQMDHLPGIIHLNFIRSLANNAEALQLKVDWLDCQVVSPFGFVGPTQTACLSPAQVGCLPENLMPTARQLRLPHHPWIDLFPLPRMRDNFLVATTAKLSEEDEIRLWNDMIENMSDSVTDSPGIIVWGDSWNIQNWEVTEVFLRNWGWLLRGCPQILESTNHWRTQRGDGPLAVDNEAMFLTL